MQAHLEGPATPPGRLRRAVRGVGDDPDRAFARLLVGITVGALVLRAIPLVAGLPYQTYVDEHWVVKPAAHQIAAGTWDPGYYLYPSLVISAAAVLAVVLGWFGLGDLDAAGLSANPRIDVIEPWTLLLGGRLFVLATAVATVTLCGLTARRLGGRRMGVVAAAFAAVMPALVQRSAIVITDSPAACFAMATIWASTNLRSPRAPMRWAAAAGAFTALAATSKYTAALVGVVPLVVLARSGGALGERARRVGVVVAAAAATAAVVMPALVLRTSAVVDAMEELSRLYDLQSATRSVAYQSLSPREMTYFVPAAVVGLVLLFRRPSARHVTGGFILYAVATVALTARYAFQPFRNVLGVVPFLCIAAAAGVVWVADLARARWSLTSSQAARLTAAGMLLLVAYPLAVVDLPRARREASVVDSRVLAIDWLEEAVGPGESVLVADELGIVPSELARLDATVVVASLDGPVDIAAHRWVVLGHRRGVPEPWTDALDGAGVVERARFGEVLVQCERPPTIVREADCPTGGRTTAWFFNDVRVTVVEVAGVAGVADPG